MAAKFFNPPDGNSFVFPTNKCLKKMFLHARMLSCNKSNISPLVSFKSTKPEACRNQNATVHRDWSISPIPNIIFLQQNPAEANEG
jgi:hypothetical protein